MTPYTEIQQVNIFNVVSCIGNQHSSSYGAAPNCCLDVDCEVPAVFTFGLSIPVGAGIGLMAGATTGGGAGVVGGEDLRFLILSEPFALSMGTVWSGEPGEPSEPVVGGHRWCNRLCWFYIPR